MLGHGGNKGKRRAESPLFGLNRDPGRLVEAYSDLILRISYTYLKSVSDAEDICQETLIKLITREESFNDQEHEKAWVIRVASNACRDLIRKQSAHEMVPFDDDMEVDAANSPEEAFDQMAEDMLSAVMCLPVIYREVIFLYYYEGYSIRDMAALLGISEAAATQRLSRGRSKLKSIMEDKSNE